MEMVLFIGLQASGKSTFYREHLFHSHVRINLDMLRTRHREQRLVEACLHAQQALVIDNTNPARADRTRYIEPARAAGFSIVGYYFRSVVAECMARNAQRPDEQRIPERGLLGTAKRLERPELDEGFDTLYYVQLSEDGFLVSPWRP
ncbi:MAG: AAA family ATPase [Myxococcota bacterium]